MWFQAICEQLQHEVYLPTDPKNKNKKFIYLVPSIASHDIKI